MLNSFIISWLLIGLVSYIIYTLFEDKISAILDTTTESNLTDDDHHLLKHLETISLWQLTIVFFVMHLLLWPIIWCGIYYSFLTPRK